MLAAAALERRESRGVHRRTDFPLPDSELDAVHLTVDPDGAIVPERWI